MSLDVFIGLSFQMTFAVCDQTISSDGICVFRQSAVVYSLYGDCYGRLVSIIAVYIQIEISIYFLKRN